MKTIILNPPCNVKSETMAVISLKRYNKAHGYSDVYEQKQGQKFSLYGVIINMEQ